MISRAQISWACLAATILSILATSILIIGRSPGIHMLSAMGIASVFLITFVIFSIIGAKVRAYLNDDHLRVTGGMLDVRVPYGKMDKVELRGDVKYGGRVAGYVGANIIGGFFGNKEFGTYRVGAYLSTPRCIVVSYNKKRTLVFNLDSLARTEQFYRDLMLKKETETKQSSTEGESEEPHRSVA